MEAKYKKYIQIVLGISFVITGSLVNSQTIPEHISNFGIYQFLDELATQKVIELNSLIKPYSRTFIANQLKDAEVKKEKLNKRQQKELEQYLIEYNLELKSSSEFYKLNLLKKKSNTELSFMPFGLFYHDNQFRASIKPVYGTTFYTDLDTLSYHRWGGVSFNGYVGDNFGFYVSLSDHSFNKNIIQPNYLTLEQGAILKGENYLDYSEIRGGITWSWKWGSLGLVKDQLVWGEGYHGTNILSGKTPSVAMLKFDMKPSKWFEFNYIHARLASDVLDSARTYLYSGSGVRKVMRDKYLVANMFTFTPWKNLNLSFGNSLVYSDQGIQLQYLIPFMFYKSVDDTYNGTDNQAGHNAQMFASISSRNIKFIHLYATAFVDEFSIRRMNDPDRQSNFVSVKAGIHGSNLFKSNLFFTAEFTRTNPLVYQHFIPATTFQTNQYCMGHYLKDNAQELFIAINYKPISKMNIGINYTNIKKGTPYIYGLVDPWGLPFMETVVWEATRVSGTLSYELLSKIFIQGEAMVYFNKGNATLYNPYYLSKSRGIAINGGISIGF